MAQQTINVGSAANDGTGDPLRTSFTKSNDNFTELYARGVVSPPQGRLTLQAATPVMTASVSASAILLYVPYVGNKVPIYDGTTMVMTTFVALTATLSDTTKNPAAIGASKVNDWYVWNDAGTIRLSHGPDWTNDTTRNGAAAIPQMLLGTMVNNLAISNGPAALRGTYVGTTRSNASSQLDWILGTAAVNGGAAFLYVWNAYNRVDVATKVSETTASWTYGVNTVRAVNGSSNNRVSFVTGLAEDCPSCTYSINTYAAAGGSIAGVGLDSTTVFSGPNGYTNLSGVYTQQTGGSTAYPAQLGAHFFQAVEWGAVNAWQGDGSSSGLFGQGLMFGLRM